MADDRRRARSGSAYEERFGFSRAIRVGDRILVSGTGPTFADGSCPDDAGVQAERCLEIMLAAIAELGGEARDVVRSRMFITDPQDGEAVGAIHRRVLGTVAPVATMVVVTALLDPRWRVEIELEAQIG